MGNLPGKTLDEIKEKVGAPNAVQSCTVADTELWETKNKSPKHLHNPKTLHIFAVLELYESEV